MKRDYVVDFITQIVGDKVKAEMVVERLSEEGLLHLGYGDADVDVIVEKFTETFGTTKTSKQDRWAARRLASKYGSQAICGIIGLLGSLQTEKFAPVVNTIGQLEEKMPSVLNFLRTYKGDEEIQV